ncbi:MAG: TolC family protein [Bosea sp. (in: a-proteobacteria)]
MLRRIALQSRPWPHEKVRWCGWLARFVLATGTVLSLGGCFVRPQPLSQSEIAVVAQLRDVGLAHKPEGSIADGAPVAGPTVLTLHLALGRAILANQDIRTENAAAVLANADSKVISADMLPALVADGSAFSRDRDQASRSRPLGSVTAGGYSLSSDRTSLTGSLGFSWHILDFGLSYLRATQSADRSLVAIEQRRRTVHRVVEETRATFLRTAVLQKLDQTLPRLTNGAQAAMAGAERIATDDRADMLGALGFQRDMLAVQRDLDQLRRGLVGADAQLRLLTGSDESSGFRLDPTPANGLGKAQTPLLHATARQLAELALANRPEIRQAALEMRIGASEAQAAIVALLPGIDLNAALSGDASTYLLNNNWIAMGARISLNLLRLLSLPDRIDTGTARTALARERAMSVASTVLMQVHVAHARYAHLATELRMAARIAQVQRRITRQIATQVSAGRMPQQALAKEKLVLLLADTRADLALADLHAAYGNLITSLGVDTLDYGQLDGRSATEIAGFLDQISRESAAAVAALSNHPKSVRRP